MGRTHRRSVDYFPFLCKEGKAMFYIEEKFGNDGFATWVKLLRQIAVTNDHYLNLSSNMELMFIAAKCKVSEEILLQIIESLCLLGEFNKAVWDQFKVVWSDKFIDNIQDAYKKRANKCITFIELMDTLNGKPEPEKQKTEKKQTGNAHSIVEDSKSDNTIGYYFRIQDNVFKMKVSEYLIKNCSMFLDSVDVVNKVPARGEIFEKMDTKYIQYRFNDENHLRNVYNKYKENSISTTKPKTTSGIKKNHDNEQL